MDILTMLRDYFRRFLDVLIERVLDDLRNCLNNHDR